MHHPDWHQLRIVLGKWARDEPLTDDDQRVLVEAQNADIERYKAMRQEARDRPQSFEHGCW
jgi:hypothetical protein